MTTEARWIGDRLRLAGAEGAVATLSPAVVLDSGYALDRRFATGVFVFRTADALDAARLGRLNLVSPATLAASLDRLPPAAIVTGYESTFGAKTWPDEAMRRYARSRGYCLTRSPLGPAELYIRPAGRACSP
jgi:hypothetical protein